MYYRELAHLSWYNMRRVTMARRGKMSHDAAPYMGTLYFHPSALLVGLTRKCTCASALWLVAASGIIDLCFSTQHQIVYLEVFVLLYPIPGSCSQPYHMSRISRVPCLVLFRCVSFRLRCDTLVNRVLPQTVPAVDACYDRGVTFRRNWLLNDRAP